MFFYILQVLILAIFTLLPILITVAFFTLAERKVMASIQRRKGPNVVGFWGILQPFADALKLVVKELIYPTKASLFIFFLAPLIVLFLSLLSWAALPLNRFSVWLDLEYSLLFFLVVSSLGVYGIFLAGWSSNSKYALLGGIRAIAQLISYEITISLILLPIIALNGSLNIIDFVYNQKDIWFIVPCLPLSILFFISILAETNRTPFDLAEAEAELVAGYNIEYSSIIFAAFFLGEYTNMLFMSSLFCILFLGGWLPLKLSFITVVLIFFLAFFLSSSISIVNILLLIFSLFFLVNFQILFFSVKTVGIGFLFIFVRSNLPRYRFDQLMFIGWKVFLPLTFGFLLFYIGVILTFEIFLLKQLPFFYYNSLFLCYQ